MDCERLPFVPDTPNDDLVLLHPFHVSETYALHTHEFYEVFYVVKGQAMHQINGSSQVVSEGSLVFIRPKDAHHYQYLNLFDFEFINVNITCALTAQALRFLHIPQEAFDAPALPPSIVLTGTQHAEMRSKFLDLSKIPAGPARRRCFCALFPEVLHLLYTQGNLESAQQVVPRWLSDVLKRLDQPDCFTKGLPELLRMTPYTQEHLTRSFRKYVHMSPTAYINQKRLGYAAELLIREPLTPPQAARMAGFHNLSHFYHRFRDQYGCTPLQFSAQHRDVQRGRYKALLGIGREAVMACIQNGASETALDNGLFAYYLQEGRAQIYVSFVGDASERGLEALAACWDARLNAGATLHINRENQALYEYVLHQFQRAPVRQTRQMALSRENFEEYLSSHLDDRVNITGFRPDHMQQYLLLFERRLPHAREEMDAEALAADWAQRGGAGRFLTLIAQDAPVGFACLSQDAVDLLVLPPEYPYQDLGDALVAEAAARIFDAVEVQCTVRIDSQDEAALAALRRLRFLQAGHEAVFIL